MGPEVKMVRAQIAEPGRYYDAHRTIVLRTGQLLVDERRALWHELGHCRRRDRACDTDEAVERLVDRQAAEDAMPWVSIKNAWSMATDLDEAADLLKAPPDWLHLRLVNLHPVLLAQLQIRL